MTLREYLQDNILYLDGGMGTLLQQRGLEAGELPERWNIYHSDVIRQIHKSYYDAGSNVVCTNTFGANILKYSEEELDNIVRSAIENAKIARQLSTSTSPKWIALDIGPSGRMLKPYGDLDFEEAIEVFAKTVRLGVKYGVDLVFVETMGDSYETKAAVLAIKENSDLPIFVSNAYGEDDKLMTGANPEAMVAILEGLGVDAIGANCSFGPAKMAGVIDEYLKYSQTPVIMEPNAGLPRVVDGSTVYDLSPDEFAKEVLRSIEKGVRICGGCCGTTPEHIRALVGASKHMRPSPITTKNYTTISSYTHALRIGEHPILIGERINPTGKPRLKMALLDNDIDYILGEGVSQQERGVHCLDVNVGALEIDETTMLPRVVERLQEIIDLPLQIDSSNVSAIENALRIINGKAIINSVNGKQQSMDEIFPLAKKYGAVVVALTLDEGGIPPTAEGRVEIAKKIITNATKWGIAKRDIVFDPLAMTVSADPNAAIQTLRAVKMISDMGYHVSLGVSNVSFGLPNRDIINSTYFTMALQRGLSMAIMNPHSDEMMKAYYSYMALEGLDDNCQDYINFVNSLPTRVEVESPKTSRDDDMEQSDSPLEQAIIKGLKERAGLLATQLLESTPPLEVIQKHVIPALDKVGVDFENKKTYLPQLLMSAEASKVAFEVVKQSMTSDIDTKKCTFVLATVKGDIHDIGKNIVKMLLQNYGFDVVDLGKDVTPSIVVDEVVRLRAPMVGLSALMTTTVPAMQETIRLLRKSAPWCKIVVGGAVLSEQYALTIGADKYASDAMETVRYAEQIYKLTI